MKYITLTLLLFFFLIGCGGTSPVTPDPSSDATLDNFIDRVTQGTLCDGNPFYDGIYYATCDAGFIPNGTTMTDAQGHIFLARIIAMETSSPQYWCRYYTAMYNVIASQLRFKPTFVRYLIDLMESHGFDIWDVGYPRLPADALIPIC